jgi:hypothetical protein
MIGPRASDRDTAPEDRTGQERRNGNRRAPVRPLDPGFAAILVNQIAPPETDYVDGYPAAPHPVRRGLMVNFRA